MALLKTYDTYKMNVYRTRRSASYPQRIYDKTREIAATAKLVSDGYGVSGAVNGYPFPIPKTGVEVIWNHLLRYRGESAERTIIQAAPTRGGSFTPVRFNDEFYMLYSMEGMQEADLKNRILFFKKVRWDFGLVNIQPDAQKRFFAMDLLDQLLFVHFFGKYMVAKVIILSVWVIFVVH
jgi:hypothetical protein